MTINDTDDTDDSNIVDDPVSVTDERTPQAEFGKLIVDAVRKAVSMQIEVHAKEVAGEATEQLLTDEVIEAMRAAAVRETEQALNPESAELHYRTLAEFVDGHIAELYRREVTARGSEKTMRWCPHWWDHGEVVSRLGALWRAFEQLRHGDGAEMNMWWIQHADPQLDRIFDPDGPFKYCSVAEGHTPRMRRLPTVAPPGGVFVDGHAHDEPVAVTQSGLVLPATPLGNRRVHMEFP